jgi:acyl-coenzyme A synthetase/AMP-(fatty) acid ligase
VPRYVERVDALPRNLSGKVLKTALRDGRSTTSSGTAGGG